MVSLTSKRILFFRIGNFRRHDVDADGRHGDFIKASPMHQKSRSDPAICSASQYPLMVGVGA